MQSMKIPEWYNTVMPYLIVKDAEGLFNFIINIFGGTEKMKVLHEDKSIMHAEVMVGDSTIMVAQSGADWQPMPAGMFIYVPNADETYKKALEAGATSIMPPEDKDYGRSGGFTDPYGNTWWVTSQPGV